MTSAQKTAVYAFLNVAEDFLAAGFKTRRSISNFKDDTDAAPQLAAATPASNNYASPAPSNYASAAPHSYDPQAPHNHDLPAPHNHDPTAPFPVYKKQNETPAGQRSLDSIMAEIALCNACELCQKRKRIVPGEGMLEPLVLVIGEAPGEEEDKTGRPFVGAAGQLLDKMLSPIGIDRWKNCFIANILKCRPPIIAPHLLKSAMFAFISWKHRLLL